MPCVAEFGIINTFEEDKDYSDYEPEKYKCISVDDDFINDWWSSLVLLKTYHHRFSRPDFALARWGVTLIPAESLEQLFSIVANDKRSKSSRQLIELMMLIREAVAEDKFVIHYGV
jgi:hypothetical protein